MSATTWSEARWSTGTAQAAATASLRVLVVDEREVVGWGFRLLLARRPWVERCLMARLSEEALALAARQDPALVLVELAMARRDELCERLRLQAPGARVILTTGDAQPPGEVVSGLGADAAISTASSARDLVTAVEAAAGGLLAWREPDDGAAAPSLSRREQEILELMSEGETNREIAARLYLSPYTVKQHTTAVYRKLGVRNRTEAAQRARRMGLVL